MERDACDEAARSRAREAARGAPKTSRSEAIWTSPGRRESIVTSDGTFFLSRRRNSRDAGVCDHDANESASQLAGNGGRIGHVADTLNLTAELLSTRFRRSVDLLW